MARIDATDDELVRYIVMRYAYDSQRNERRNQVVAAFGDRSQFEAFLDAAADELRRRRAAGEDVDPQERISGVVKAAGDDARQRASRAAMRAIKHGASPPRYIVEQLGLESSTARFHDP